VFGTRATGGEAERTLTTIHIPFTTFQQAFNFGDKVGWFAIVAKPDVLAADVEKQVREVLAERHKVAPDDKDAIGSFNLGEKFAKVSMFFTALNFVMWFAGIMTLFAGVVGVSNIMLISVRERTKEIGVRKALGATPGKVVRMILSESVVLTVIAGYLGIVAGVGALVGAGAIIEKLGDDVPFAPPPVDLRLATAAAIVIAVFGAIAGLIPAYHASKIAPVEALRTE